MKPTDKEIVEAMARAIFESMLSAALVGWVDNGNSLKQDDARDYTRVALAVAKTMLAQQSAPDSVHVLFTETGE